MWKCDGSVTRTASHTTSHVGSIAPAATQCSKRCRRHGRTLSCGRQTTGRRGTTATCHSSRHSAPWVRVTEGVSGTSESSVVPATFSMLALSPSFVRHSPVSQAGGILRGLGSSEINQVRDKIEEIRMLQSRCQHYCSDAVCLAAQARPWASSSAACSRAPVPCG